MKPYDSRASDLPRDQIMELANDTLKKFPGAQVFFNFTCPDCGERCTFDEPNQLFERGTCYLCGADRPVEKAGFSLLIYNFQIKE